MPGRGHVSLKADWMVMEMYVYGMNQVATLSLLLIHTVRARVKREDRNPVSAR